MLIAVILKVKFLAWHIYSHFIVDINLVLLSHFCCVSIQKLDCAFDKFDKILDIDFYIVDDVSS